MSLHAQLSPEAEEQLRAQKRNSTVSSIFISMLVIILLALIMAFIFLPSLFVESPTIVTYNSGAPDEEELEKKEINNQIKRQPSAPSSSMAKVIASTTPSPTAIPIPEVDVPNPSTDFGSGDDFGDGWGSGGDGGGGGFGNIPATMRKRCSAADRLARLSDNGGTPSAKTPSSTPCAISRSPRARMAVGGDPRSPPPASSSWPISATVKRPSLRNSARPSPAP